MPRHKRPVPSSQITAFIERDRLDRLLEPWVPDAEERAFVLRCILEEGPAHHRGANYILLLLLGQLIERAGARRSPRGARIPIPLRLPPHLERDEEEASFPLPLPSGPLERLAPAGSPQLAAMIDCLTDGPPQHALANAAMVWLIGELLEGGEIL